MENVTSLGSVSGNGCHTSPMQALENAINDIKEGYITPNKILILSLDTSLEGYSTSFHQAGMRMSECIALCEVAKVRFLQEMEYIPND